ncbi:unnamed protein product, partial [Closterium sp. NIES-64]
LACAKAERCCLFHSTAAGHSYCLHPHPSPPPSPPPFLTPSPPPFPTPFPPSPPPLPLPLPPPLPLPLPPPLPPPPSEVLKKSGAECPTGAGQSCVVKQSLSSQFCYQCSEFCPSCIPIAEPTPPSPPPPPPPHSSGLSVGAIVGISLGGVLAAALLAVGAWLLYKRKSMAGWCYSYSLASSLASSFLTSSSLTSSSLASSSSLLCRVSRESSSGPKPSDGASRGGGASVPTQSLMSRESSSGAKPSDGASKEAGASVPTQSLMCQRYPLDVVAKATDNWAEANHIGAPRYSPITSNERCVCMREATAEEELIEHVEEMASKSHPHLVRLLGYCVDMDTTTEHYEQIVIYEFCTNGDLEKYLSGGSKKGELTLQQRMDVLVGVARGLEYLHQFDIVHRDIKPANVLLDANMQPKVSDFGLVRMTEGTTVNPTRVVGTPGYVDPAYSRTSKVTPMADVYRWVGLIKGLSCGRLAQIMLTKPVVMQESGGINIRDWTCFGTADPFLRSLNPLPSLPLPFPPTLPPFVIIPDMLRNAPMFKRLEADYHSLISSPSFPVPSSPPPTPRFCSFVIIPDMLRNAPMFKRLEAKLKGKGSSNLGVGRGRAVAMRAKARSAARGALGAAPDGGAPMGGGMMGRGAPPPRR